MADAAAFCQVTNIQIQAGFLRLLRDYFVTIL